MAKKQKREEKAQRRLEKKNSPDEQGQQQPDTGAGPDQHPPEPEPQSS